MRFAKVLPLGIALSLVAAGCDDSTSPDGDDVLQNDVTEDQTLTDVESDPAVPDYIVSGVLDVSATLTIEPGVAITFQEDAGFRVNDGGAILAQGTEDAPIQLAGEEATPGFWRGLYFRADDRTSELNHVFGEHGGRVWDGADEAATIVVGNDASVSMTNSVIRGSSASGVYLEPRAELAEFATNIFEENGGHSAFIPDIQMGAMDSKTSYGVDVLVYATVGIDREMTVAPLSSSLDGPEYRMRGFFEVNAPVTLNPGVTLAFEEDGAVRVNDGGAILAQGQGSAEEVISLTGVQETPGFWRGILFRADDLESELDFVQISYGGRDAFGGADVAANITVDNDARLRLSNSVIMGSGSYGLYVKPRGQLPGFSNNFFLEDTDAPAFIPDKQMGAIDSGTSISQSSPQYLRVYSTGGISEEMTVSPIGPNESYRLTGFFEVNAPVTIEAEVVMEFEEDAAIRVNDGGALLARGVQDHGILMYGVEETPGFWRGILFRADDLTSELNHVSIRYGGREAFAGIEEPANISVEAGAHLMLTNSLIRDSGGWGVWLDHPTDAVFAEEGNAYDGNASGDVGVSQ